MWRVGQSPPPHAPREERKPTATTDAAAAASGATDSIATARRRDGRRRDGQRRDSQRRERRHIKCRDGQRRDGQGHGGQRHGQRHDGASSAPFPSPPPRHGYKPTVRRSPPQTSETGRCDARRWRGPADRPTRSPSPHPPSGARSAMYHDGGRLVRLKFSFTRILTFHVHVPPN